MFSTPTVKQSGTALHVEHGNDSNLYVEFTMESVHQPFLSEKEGRPIFKDVPYVRILFPGDKTKQVFRPINEEDKVRFRHQYEAFTRQGIQVQNGTPITEWPPLTKSEAMEYKAMNIHTIEALASLPDSALTWLGARERRELAKRYLDASKDGAAITAMQAELRRKDDDIAALKAQMADLAARVPTNEDEKPKRGRPAKTTEE